MLTITDYIRATRTLRNEAQDIDEIREQNGMHAACAHALTLIPLEQRTRQERQWLSDYDRGLINFC